MAFVVNLLNASTSLKPLKHYLKHIKIKIQCYMFRPYWVILRQRIYRKELLLHCFASSRWIVFNTSYFALCLRPLYVFECGPLVLLCVRLVLTCK
jgi:hypothetical protein